MTESRKVQITVSMEGHQPLLEVDIQDTDGDGTVSDAEVRAQAEAQIRANIDRNADHPPGRVEVVSFRVDDNNDRVFNEPVRRFTSNPLTFDINTVRRTTASVDTAGLNNPIAGLSSVAYDSDGQPNQSGSESLSFSRNLFRLYNVDFDAWARNPGSVTLPEGLQAIIQSGNRRTTFAGADGSAPVSSVLNDARTELTHNADATSATDPLHQSIINGSPDMSEIDRKIRRLQAQLDELVWKLQHGMIEPVDAYSQMMSLHAQIVNLIGGEAMLRNSTLIQAKMNDYRESSRTTAEAMDGHGSGHQGAATRGQADQQMIMQDIQALQRVLTAITDTMAQASRDADQATAKRGQILGGR